MLLRRLRQLVLTVLVLMTAGTACIFVSVSHQLHEGRPPEQVPVPARAHLNDGRIVHFPNGIEVVGDSIKGRGTLYGLRLDSLGTVTGIPLSDVLALEAVHGRTNVATTLLIGVPLTIAAIAGLAVAAFGSCPTFYAPEGDTFVMEAEGFSYSISPLLEARDVDRLGISRTTEGHVTLEVRNEALETHFINHLEVLEVRHRAHELVLPDPQGQPLALSSLRAPSRATDRSGRDVRALLTARDDAAYATPDARLSAATEDDLADWIEIVADRPRGADSIAVALHMRNSLLTTILLYDHMLGAQGAQALTWLGRDVEVIENALDLARWYTKHLGMRVAVRDGNEWREVARIPATGPIAWKSLALVIPVPAGDSVHLRLSFAADEWRVDQVAIGVARHVRAQVAPLARVVDAEDRERPDIVRQLADPDDRYLETRPGTRFTAHFAVSDAPLPGGIARTFFLASQGYYVEWIRGDWVRQATAPVPFVPSEHVLLEAMRSWHAQRDTFEERFYGSRIPVR